MADSTQLPPPKIPAHRNCPFVPPEFDTEVRESGRPQRGTLWNGTHPWLVAAYDQVKQVLLNPVFSMDVTNPHFPNITSAQAQFEGGHYHRTDGAEHMRVRRMLNPDFTSKRSESWRARIVEIVEETIDDMEKLPRPVDLVEHFALRIPTAIICELLGVDLADSPVVRRAGDLATDLDIEPNVKLAAIGKLVELLLRCIQAKRARPDDRMLSRLVNEYVPKGDLTLDQVVRIGLLMIVAGHETTGNMLSLSALSLMRDPTQRDLLLSDPQKYGSTCIEELLRYWSIVQAEPRRVAKADVELGGALIRKGDGILCSLAAANRDPVLFPSPDELDIARPDNGNLAFGFGPHQCLGQNLARIEMHEALLHLFQRLPNLRLAVPESELRYRHTHIIYGLHALPVTW